MKSRHRDWASLCSGWAPRAWCDRHTSAGTVALDPIEFTAASQFDVLEARSRLVAGDD